MNFIKLSSVQMSLAESSEILDGGSDRVVRTLSVFASAQFNVFVFALLPQKAGGICAKFDPWENVQLAE